MANSIQEKVQKCFESRPKAETELKKVQNDIVDAVDHSERRACVVRLVKSCEAAMTKALTKNEKLLELAKKSNDPAMTTTELEKWLRDVTAENDEILKKAREYIDQYPEQDKISQSSRQTTTVRSKSSKATSSKISKTSSQRQRDLIIAQQRREEIERQNEATLRLAKQKQQLELEQRELELQKLRKELALRVEELEEENRRKLAQATLVEMELRDDLSDSNADFRESLSRLGASSEGKETARINDWVNNSPSGAEIEMQPNIVAQATKTSTDNFGVQLTPQSLPVNVFASAPVAVQPRIPEVNPTTTTQRATNQNQVSMPLTEPPVLSNPSLTVPVSHILPNMSAWTISTAFNNHSTQPSQLIRVTTTNALSSSAPSQPVPVKPVTCRGTVYYVPPPVVTPDVTGTTTQPSSWIPNASAAPFVPPSLTTAPPTSSASLTLPEVAQLLASTKKDHLPEWKLSQYSGDPIQWHELFGQFKSAIDSAPLSDDVKLTYLKTLVTGKAKVAIAEFAYCGAMYKDALKTLERKFGQPQAVVTAYLDKLANVLPVKMHNSESIISYSATVSSLVGVFRSLNYNQDLSSASLLGGQAVQKLPPNMKEAWSMHTVKRSLDRPTLIDFNEWLKDKAEAHERMKTASGKPNSGENPQPSVNKTKTTSKVFAATASTNQQSNSSKPKSDKLPIKCAACKEKRPLWKCPVFRKKTPTERAKLVVDNKLCFSCFNANHSFRQCPHPRKCSKDGCESTHNTFLHGADRIFPSKNQVTKPRGPETSTCIGTAKLGDHVKESSGLASVTNVKGLLQITEIELHSADESEKVLALCNSACSHTWISARLAKKLKVQGVPIKLTVHGINSQQVVDTQMVELKLTPVHSGGSCSPFTIKPYVRDNLSVGTDTIDVDRMKTKYPYLEPVPLHKYSYADVDMILGQDVFHFIRPLEYFDSDCKNAPVAVRLPLGWVLSGPLPATSGCMIPASGCIIPATPAGMIWNHTER